MSTPLHAIGPFALIQSPASHQWAMVRVVNAGKRTTEVETMHENPADRLRFHEVTVGLWHFPSETAAQHTRDRMNDSRRAATRLKVAPENAGTRPRIRPANEPGRLLCAGHGAYGYGNTPVEAYEQWEKSRRRIRVTPNRNQPCYA